MRGRAIGLGLLGLGAFALVAALMVKLFLAPALVKLPLSQPVSLVAVDPAATYFNLGEQKQHQGETVTARQGVTGLPKAEGAGGGVAVWASGTTVEDGANQLITPPTTYQVCLDRRTSASVDCPSAKVGDKPQKITGLTLNFPFDTKKQSYDVFDPTAAKSFSARFTGTGTVQGVGVYTFAQTVPATVVQSAEVPGSMAGSPAQSNVRADVVYTNQRTFSVEPSSGVIVNIEEHPTLVFRGPDGATGVTLLAATLSADKKTLAAAVKRAEDGRSQISMISTILPLGLLLIGVIAIIVGALLLRRGPSGAHRSQSGIPSTPDAAEDAHPTVVAPRSAEGAGAPSSSGAQGS
jgi:hypothetical protein